jgi:hypothetical protein
MAAIRTKHVAGCRLGVAERCSKGPRRGGGRGGACVCTASWGVGASAVRLDLRGAKRLADSVRGGSRSTTPLHLCNTCSTLGRQLDTLGHHQEASDWLLTSHAPCSSGCSCSGTPVAPPAPPAQRKLELRDTGFAASSARAAASGDLPGYARGCSHGMQRKPLSAANDFVNGLFPPMHSPFRRLRPAPLPAVAPAAGCLIAPQPLKAPQ